jgi:hypothetical protein
MKNLILRDTRLKGYMSSVVGAVMMVEVDGATSLATAFRRIETAAKLNKGKLETLFILCHGIGSGLVLDDGWWRGGQGLELGLENVNSTNVSNFSAIKNLVKSIVVYACGAAYTGISPTGVTSDGRTLMAELSRQTNTVVYAADKVQWYSPNNFNFDKWEGTVYMFTPSGNVYPNFKPTFEMAEVI